MRHNDSAQRARTWVVDYSAARAKAIEWLGDRYLLAKPINRVAVPRRLEAWNRPITPLGRS